MSTHSNDPLDFVRSLWGGMGFNLPGMVTPTVDVGELEKRISDLKAVEGWLRMNLSMLQMTIQGLEMQKSTLSAVQAMTAVASSEEGQAEMAQAALWPWQMMRQMQEQMQSQMDSLHAAASGAETGSSSSASSTSNDSAPAASSASSESTIKRGRSKPGS